ncbi:hypothetical protein AVEN_93978-1 [Araneus ventricosus]|uniref:Uncharacterized protein n=1 Tax=Araneus ventricosus TaxID=182803 RepID=A0A4Y2CLF7_ARAVE|nr:hypothetical protein AVEN_93978-1 [Araneus ventricosus]
MQSGLVVSSLVPDDPSQFAHNPLDRSSKISSADANHYSGKSNLSALLLEFTNKPLNICADHPPSFCSVTQNNMLMYRCPVKSAEGKFLGFHVE